MSFVVNGNVRTILVINVVWGFDSLINLDNALIAMKANMDIELMFNIIGNSSKFVYKNGLGMTQETSFAKLYREFMNKPVLVYIDTVSKNYLNKK